MKMTELPLNADSLTDFQRDGYVAYRDFFSQEEVTELRQKLAEYIELLVPVLPGTEAFFEDLEDPTSLKQLQRMSHHHRYFHHLARDSRLSQLAQQLLQDEVVVKEVSWFNKPARTGKATPAHQDGYYFNLTPNEALTLWIPLEPVNEENGCVNYVPGSHLRGVRPHGSSRVLGFSQTITDYSGEDRAAEVLVPANPGDLLIHHSLTIHGAGPNISQRNRPAFGMVYFAQRAKVDTVALEAYRRKLEAELKSEKRVA